MKNIVMASLLAFVLSTSATAQQTTKITGYKLGTYAVTGDIEQQTIAKVVKPIETALHASPNNTVSISIDGYADQIGSGAANDRLAKDRADEMKNYLTRTFPTASFVPTLTKGADAEANARMAIVTWRITATAIPTATPEISSRQMRIIGGVAVLLAIFALFLMYRPNAHAEQSQPLATEAIPAPTPTVRKPKWVTFSKNECTYKALITPKDDGWESPFTINGRPIFYADERGIIKSLKGCVVQEQFKDQFAQLIAAGKVIKEES